MFLYRVISIVVINEFSSSIMIWKCWIWIFKVVVFLLLSSIVLSWWWNVIIKVI